MNPSGILKKLLSDDAVANGLVSERIFPVLIPQNTVLPAIRTQVVGAQPFDTKSGPSEVDNIQVQVDCYGDSFNAAARLAENVRRVIDKYRGDVVVTDTTYRVQGIKFLSRQEMFEDEARKWRVSSDFIFRVEVAVLRGNSAAATITGTGALSASLRLVQKLAATLSGASSVSATLKASAVVSANFSGAGSLTAGLKIAVRPSAALSGAGSVSATLTVVGAGGAVALAATLTATGQTTAALKIAQKAAATMTATGTVSATAKTAKKAAATASASGTVSATLTVSGTGIGSVSVGPSGTWIIA